MRFPRTALALAALLLAAAVRGANAITNETVMATFADTDTIDAVNGATIFCRAGAEVFGGIARSDSAAYCVGWPLHYAYNSYQTQSIVLVAAQGMFPLNRSNELITNTESIAAFDSALRDLGFYTLAASQVTTLQIVTSAYIGISIGWGIGTFFSIAAIMASFSCCCRFRLDYSTHPAD